ncbi:carboxypeptidase regulatory-like domain-containing protein [bacterium]|nr:carboxypeptidase regulatory-like domain-containing protein [bacterium]
MKRLSVLGLVWALSMCPAFALRVLEGRVLCGDEPVVGARLELLRWDAQSPVVAESERGGAFRFFDVSSGNYRLTANAPGCALYELAYLRVGDEQEKMTLRLVLSPEAIFSGTATDHLTGEPLADAWIELSEGGPERRVRTDAAGAFHLTQLYPGVYRLSATGPERVPYVRQGFRLEGGREATATLPLFRAGSLEGRLVFPEGEAGSFPGLRLELQGPAARWAVSDRLGRFKFDGLPPGRYRMTVKNAGFFETSLDPLQLEEGEKKAELELRLSPHAPSFNVFTQNQMVLPERPFEIPLRAFRTPRIEQRWYALSARRFFDRLDDPRDPAAWNIDGASPDKLWMKEIKYARPYTWVDERISMRGQPAGLYVLESAAGGATDRLMIVATELGLVAKSSPAGILIYAVDLSTGRKRAGVPVRLVRAGALVAEATSDADGLVVFPVKPIAGMRAIALSGPHFASVDAVFGQEAPKESGRVYVYTERPIYRPGQTLYWKAVIRAMRSDSGGPEDRYLPPATGEARYKIEDSRNQTVAEGTVPLNAMGSTSGLFRLGEEAPLGTYRISVSDGRFSGQAVFEVEEYRKPEYLLTVDADRPYSLGGESIRFRLHAMYFFGSPLAGVPVRYNLYSSEYAWGGYGELLESGNLKTDGEGRAMLDFVPPAAAGTRWLTLEVTLEDASGRQVRAEHRVRVVEGEFTLSLTVDQRVVRAGMPVVLRLRARDHAGQPRAARVALEITRWKYDPRVGDRQREVVADEFLTVPESGETSYLYTPRQGGRLEITALATDSRGHAIRDVLYLWVQSDEEEPVRADSAFALTLGKEDWKPGETLRAVVLARAPDGDVLFTLEREQVVERRMVRLKGGVAMLELPVTEALAPGCRLAATLMRGLSFYSAAENIKVQGRLQRLSVELSFDRPEYQPGERMRLSLLTLDAEGRPVAAECSVGLVDEAIYSLAQPREEPIHEFFYGHFVHLVRTQRSFPPQYLGGADKGPGAGLRIRRDFRDTAFWSAVVTTDVYGRAVVEIPLPDNLTTWRATARAHTVRTEVGEAIAKTVVRKPVVARLVLPRFLVEGDRAVVSGIVHNYAEADQELDVELSVAGARLSGRARQSARIAKGGMARFTWPVVAETVGAATFTLSARGRLAGDGMELAIPVQAYGLPRAIYLAGELDRKDAATLDFRLPKEARSEGRRLRLDLSPTLLSGAWGSLQYLAGYPYGCVEQTLSRFVPTVVLKRAQKPLGFDLPFADEEIDRMVAAGLLRLYDFQRAEGGWGWWKTDPVDPMMTASAVDGLRLCREAGYAVSPEVLAKGVASLRFQLQSLDDIDRIAVVMLAIAEAESFAATGEVGSATPLEPRPPLYGTSDLRRTALWAFGQRQALSPAGRAALLATLAGYGLTQEAQLLARETARDAVETSNHVYWTGRADHPWLDDSVDATARMLSARLACDPHDALNAKAARWLLAQREGERWSTTRQAASALLALARFAERQGGGERPEGVRLSGLPPAPKSVAFPADGRAGLSFLVQGRPLEKDRLRVKLERLGGGTAYYGARLDYLVSGDKLTGWSRGLSLSRSALLVSERLEGRELKLETEPRPERLAAGDRILVQLELTVEQPVSYLMVESPMPAGFEWSPGKLETPGWGHHEVRDERVVFFFYSLAPGRHKIAYTLRAEMEGEFIWLPARAYPMYTPEVFGESDGDRLRVGPRS